MKIGLSMEEPVSNVYRVTIVHQWNNDKEVRTVNADNPDGAVARIIDMLTGGLMEPDEFWDKWRIESIIKE